MPLSILESSVDSEIYYFAKKLDINGKRVNTPIKTMHPSLSGTDLSRSVKMGLYEIWKPVSFNEIKDAPVNNDIATSFARKIRRIANDISPDFLKTFLAEIKFDKDVNPFPLFQGKTLSFVLDAFYLYTDFISFPIIEKSSKLVTNPKLCTDYQAYIQECYEISETLNVKPIMGIIPPVPQNFIAAIVQKYLDLEIKSFGFDFDGLGLSSLYPHYREFMRTLYRHDKDSFDQKVIHVFNLKLPANTNRDRPFPAEDMVIPALGADVLGLSHKNFAGNKEFVKTSQKKGKPKRKSPSRINLLNTNEYNYYRIENTANFKEIFKDTPITPSDSTFTGKDMADRNAFQKRFNFLQASTELDLIHEKIVNNEPIMQLLTTKSGIERHINHNIKNLKTYTAMKDLRDFF